MRYLNIEHANWQIGLKAQALRFFAHCYAYLIQLVSLVIILIQKMLPDEFSDEGHHGDDPKSVYIDEVSQCLSVCPKSQHCLWMCQDKFSDLFY